MPEPQKLTLGDPPFEDGSLGAQGLEITYDADRQVLRFGGWYDNGQGFGADSWSGDEGRFDISLADFVSHLGLPTVHTAAPLVP